MSKLQELLDERYPIIKDMPDADLFPLLKKREIFGAAYEIAFRAGYTEGYNAAKEENLKHYGNTLLVSVASEGDENGNVASDLMLEGDAEKIGSALAVQMQKHPELLNFIEYSLSLYDNLISHD